MADLNIQLDTREKSSDKRGSDWQFWLHTYLCTLFYICIRMFFCRPWLKILIFLPILCLEYSCICGGVLEQLARYTMRYQESDLHLAFILHNLLTTSACSTSTLLFLIFSINFPINFCSSIVAVSIAKAGHVWVSWPEEFLLYFLSLTLQQVFYCQGID